MDLPSGVKTGCVSTASLLVSGCELPLLVPSIRISRSVPLLSRDRKPAKVSCLSLGDHEAPESPAPVECWTQLLLLMVTIRRPGLTEYTIRLPSCDRLGSKAEPADVFVIWTDLDL